MGSERTHVDKYLCTVCGHRHSNGWYCKHSIDAKDAEIERLKAERDAAYLAHESSEAVLHMTVARLGGLVEGRPTHRGNFLQRIDALVRMEECNGK